MASGKRVLSTRMTSAPRQPADQGGLGAEAEPGEVEDAQALERHGRLAVSPALWRHGADDSVISDTRVRERHAGRRPAATPPGRTGRAHAARRPGSRQRRRPRRRAARHVRGPAAGQVRRPGPAVDVRDDGTEIWRFDGKEATNIGLNAVSGRPVEEYGIEPTSFAEIRPGCYDIHDRVRDMDANGVIASMCFPSFPQLCGQLFAKASDPDLGLAVLRAYNDWHIDEWCGTYPGRFIPLSLPPIWDPDAMADEVRRVAAKGCHAVSFSENPAKLKLPSFHSDHWDPFWSACSRRGHHGVPAHRLVVVPRGHRPGRPHRRPDRLQPVNIVQAAADLLWSPVLRKFPDLKVALSEGGIGWMPVLPRPHGLDLHPAPPLDRPGLRRQAAERGLPRAGGDVLHRRPRRRRAAPPGGHRLDVLGGRLPPLRLDLARCRPRPSWSPSTASPTRRSSKMTYKNAIRHYRFDPFAHRPKEQCTVGALRAGATDVDVSQQATSLAGATKGPA